MRTRRIACLILGAWIGVALFLALAATRNFETVDAVLKSPPVAAGKTLQTAGHDNARMLLRYVAGESNGSLFDAFDVLSIGTAAALTLMLFWERQTRYLSAVALAMVLLATFVHVKVTPEIQWLGRSIAFLPWNADPPVRAQFASMHRIYGILLMAELAIATVLSGILIMMKPRRRSRRDDIEDAPAVWQRRRAV